MKKNIDYFEDNNSQIADSERIITSAIELQEMIEQKLENEPKGELRKIWKKETNSLIEQYNSSFGKCYKRII